MKTRIRKEKINKRNRVREEEELTEEWADGLKNKTNERMKTRETMGASGNTKNRRKRLLVVSAEEQYAGGGYEREVDRKKGICPQESMRK